MLYLSRKNITNLTTNTYGKLSSSDDIVLIIDIPSDLLVTIIKGKMYRWKEFSRISYDR